MLYSVLVAGADAAGRPFIAVPQDSRIQGKARSIAKRRRSTRSDAWLRRSKAALIRWLACRRRGDPAPCNAAAAAELALIDRDWPHVLGLLDAILDTLPNTYAQPFELDRLGPGATALILAIEK